MGDQNRFYMAGSEGTGRYIVVAVSNRGRVGFRDLGAGKYRVRVEPASEELAGEVGKGLSGWKQPESGKPRFSLVVEGDGFLRGALKRALRTLGIKWPEGTEFNPSAPEPLRAAATEPPEPEPATAEELGARAEAAEARVAELELEVEELEQGLSQAQADVEELEQGLSQAQATAAAAETKLATLRAALA